MQTIKNDAKTPKRHFAEHTAISHDGDATTSHTLLFIRVSLSLGRSTMAEHRLTGSMWLLSCPGPNFNQSKRRSNLLARHFVSFRFSQSFISEVNFLICERAWDSVTDDSQRITNVIMKNMKQVPSTACYHHTRSHATHGKKELIRHGLTQPFYFAPSTT